jgi:hypothetical protein
VDPGRSPTEVGTGEGKKKLIKSGDVCRRQ